ncbi:MAG: SpoIIE family protein phosphatase [Lentisphaerota bacterium]
MLKNRGIAFKLNALILTVSVLILIFALLFNYYSTKKLLVEELRSEAELTSKIATQDIEFFFELSERIAKTLAKLMESDSYEYETITHILTSIVYTHPQIFGSSVAFAPFAYDKKVKFCSINAFETKNGIKTIKNLSDSDDYTKEQWYSDVANSKIPCWTEPYVQKSSNKVMITYSVPFFTDNNGQSEFTGVARIDISLKWFITVIEGVDAFRTAYALILSKEGKMIYFPYAQNICQSVFEYAKAVDKPLLADLGRRMIAGESDFSYMYSPLVKKTGWIFFGPIGKEGWSMAIFLPDDKLNKDLSQLNFIMFSISLSGVVLLMVLIFLITARLTYPIRRLTHSVRVIGRGKLDAQIKTTNNNDEVGVLTRSFEDMRTSLINYIENLKRTTAEKESYETELKIAASIQHSILPVIDDRFKSELYELYVNLVPAKEVSGDFYDFFFIDGETLAIVVADVSGKGFPAAFFMSMAKFAIKNICKTTKNLSPGEILGIANNLICAEDESSMFLTCYLMFYNIKTGFLKYANAGHHDMVHVLSDGGVEEKGILNNKPIGFFPDEKYNDKEFYLQKNEIIALSTDGIVEAPNKDNIQFGSEKIAAHFAKNCKEPIRTIGDSLVKNVLEFEDSHRFDDITLLILKRT